MGLVNRELTNAPMTAIALDSHTNIPDTHPRCMLGMFEAKDHMYLPLRGGSHQGHAQAIASETSTRPHLLHTTGMQQIKMWKKNRIKTKMQKECQKWDSNPRPSGYGPEPHALDRSAILTVVLAPNLVLPRGMT